MNNPIQKISFMACLVFGISAFANTSSDPDYPISHCYHWIQADKGYLNFKYDFAEKHSGELTFYTTPSTSNGSIAGPGLYCAKSPSGSYGYGNRIVKIELVRDVVLLDDATGSKHCGTDGKALTAAECQTKNWDIKLYDKGRDWYVIQNPAAIARWTAVGADLETDLAAEKAYADSGYDAKVQPTITLMRADAAGKKVFVNGNARLSLAQLIKKNPSAVNAIPTLSVLNDLASPATQSQIDAATFEQVLRSTARRFLADDSTNFEDIRKLLSKAAMRTAFSQESLRLAVEFGNGSIKSANLAAITESLNLSADVVNQDLSPFFAALAENDIALGTLNLSSNLQASLEVHAMTALNALLNKGGEKIPALLKYLSAAQKLRLSESTMSPVRQQLNQEIQASGNTRYGIVADNQYFPIIGTLKDSIQLCANYISSLNLSNKEIKLRINSNEISMGIIGDAKSANAYCQARSDYFKGLVKSISTGEDVHFVVGNMEKIPFNFHLQYLEDLLPQVQQFINQYNLMGVSNITLTVDGNNTITVQSTSSFWTTSNQIVNAMGQKLSQFGIYTKQQASLNKKVAATSATKSMVLTGSLNSQRFSISGDSLDEIISECMSYGQAYNMNSIDTISISLNQAPAISQSNPKSYWQGPAQVCGVIKEMLSKNTKKKK